MRKDLYLNEISTIVEPMKHMKVPTFVVFSRSNNLSRIMFWIKSIRKERLFAVRSSSNNEDQMNVSNAGKYQTFLNVTKEELLNKIEKVFETSEFVIVQEMIIDPDISGVAFIKDKCSSINLSPGLCAGITEGKVFSIKMNYLKDSFVEIDMPPLILKTYMEEGELRFKEVQMKYVEVLDKYQDTIEKLFKFKKFFDFDMDIEFSIKNNILYILQIRPIVNIEVK